MTEESFAVLCDALEEHGYPLPSLHQKCLPSPLMVAEPKRRRLEKCKTSTAHGHLQNRH